MRVYRVVYRPIRLHLLNCFGSSSITPSYVIAFGTRNLRRPHYFASYIAIEVETCIVDETKHS